MLALSGPETLTYYWRMLHQLAGFRTIDTSTESDSEPDNTLPPVGKKFNHLKKNLICYHFVNSSFRGYNVFSIHFLLLCCHLLPL